MVGVSLPDLSRTLPDLILAAQRRLDELFLLGDLRKLPRRAYRVLREHLGKLDLHQLRCGACFELTSHELEEALDCCERTVSYAHSDLVAWGLIERPAPSLRGRRSPVWRTFLTPRALALLLVDQAQGVAPPLDKEQTLSGGQGAAPQAGKEVVHNPRQPAPALSPSGQRFHLRRDLAPLLQVLVPRQIKKLLSIAKRARVWLQNIMAHRLPEILRANDPEGYLVHLIHSGEDWTRPAATAATAPVDGTASVRAPQNSGEAATAAASRAFLSANAGRWLAKPDRSALLQVLPDRLIEHASFGRRWLEGVVPEGALPKVMLALDAGRLEFLEAASAEAILASPRPDDARERFLARRRA